jgi:hypothetical protein
LLGEKRTSTLGVSAKAFTNLAMTKNWAGLSNVDIMQGEAQEHWNMIG